MSGYERAVPKPVIINNSNSSTGSLIKHTRLLSNPRYWHKVVVQNCDNIHRDVILKAVLDAAYPHDLIPVHFNNENKNASFLARNCKLAIEKLCQQNLIAANPLNSSLPFKLFIVLAHSTTNELNINVQDNVIDVLNKRYNSVTRMLNLDAFYKDSDLKEFCTLSQPKILYFVLHLAKTLNIHQLKLSNNGISILSPVESLWGVKNLSSLDLRNNSIKTMKELAILSSLPIHDLWLDGNPLCDDYDEFTYVQAVKELCPQIEKLDGLLLRHNGFPAFRRNYLCNSEGQELIDHFLEHYFALYDSEEKRCILSDLYSNEATFSLSCHYIPGQHSSATASLAIYGKYSRNIQTLSNLDKSMHHLAKGKNNIIKMLCFLPITEHDPYSFTVDLVYYSHKNAVIVVTGVFREPVERLSTPERILGFCRTFVLTRVQEEYKIINEQLHVSNATINQQQRAFKIVKVEKPNVSTLPNATSQKEKFEMIEALKTITTMNSEWSKKCLEDCNFDLKRTLMQFVDLYKVDVFPEEAFHSDDTSNGIKANNTPQPLNLPEVSEEALRRENFCDNAKENSFSEPSFDSEFLEISQSETNDENQSKPAEVLVRDRKSLERKKKKSRSRRKFLWSTPDGKKIRLKYWKAKELGLVKCDKEDKPQN